MIRAPVKRLLERGAVRRLGTMGERGKRNWGNGRCALEAVIPKARGEVMRRGLVPSAAAAAAARCRFVEVSAVSDCYSRGSRPASRGLLRGCWPVRSADPRLAKRARVRSEGISSISPSADRASTATTTICRDGLGHRRWEGRLLFFQYEVDVWRGFPPYRFSCAAANSQPALPTLLLPLDARGGR